MPRATPCREGRALAAPGRSRRHAARSPRALASPSMSETQGAWGAGLATVAGEKVLDTWFPSPRLGADGAPAAPPPELREAGRADERRGARAVAVVGRLDALAAAPADAS